MFPSRYKPHLALIAVLAVATPLLVFAVKVAVSTDASVRTTLPVTVGQWEGEDILFCQAESCRKAFLVSQVTNTNACATCGGALRASWSVAERLVLPPDTVLLKKRYRHPSGQTLTVSVVLNGKEQGSIHRPEMCLVGQGLEIVSRTTFSVPLDGRKPLWVMSLETVHRQRQSGGQLEEYPSYYAYWFTGTGRETPYHVMRVLYTVVDRVLFARAYRWAYLAVTGPRQPDSADYQQQVRDFVRVFYPLIAVP